MLVISSYKKGETICVKVSTGEESVARFEAESGDIQVVKPCVITLNPQNGQAMLIPWLMSIDTTSSDPITIRKEHIITTNKPNKSLSDAYIQNTTGIAPATIGSAPQLKL